MQKIRFTAALLACLVLAAAFMAGCSTLETDTADVDTREVEEPTATPEPTETPTPEPTETPEPSPTVLYNSYGTGESEVLFTNNTDFVFRDLQIQEPTATEYGENLVASDAPIQQGETFGVKYTADAAVVTPDPEEEIVFNDQVYNIKLTTDAGEEYVLYDNDFTNMDTAFIRWDEEGDVLYIEFMSKNTNEVVNTLEAQLFMKDYMNGAVDETPQEEARAAASSGSSGSDSSHSSSASGSSGGGSHSGGSSSSGSSGSSSSSSGGSGSGSSSGSSDSGSAGSGSSSSGGSSAGDSSSAGSGSSGGDDWSGGDAGAGDCLEDNIVWND
ncbi:MAG: hypothetical protein HDQ87_04065 [Clostridia bacterium]|nr:hypothetical protein [Clostridia bacterium]